MVTKSVSKNRKNIEQDYRNLAENVLPKCSDCWSQIICNNKKDIFRLLLFFKQKGLYLYEKKKNKKHFIIRE